MQFDLSQEQSILMHSNVLVQNLETMDGELSLQSEAAAWKIYATRVKMRVVP